MTLFVKGGPAPLATIGEPKQCESIGGAAMVWAKIKPPADRMLELRH